MRLSGRLMEHAWLRGVLIRQRKCGKQYDALFPSDTTLKKYKLIKFGGFMQTGFLGEGEGDRKGAPGAVNHAPTIRAGEPVGTDLSCPANPADQITTDTINRSLRSRCSLGNRPIYDFVRAVRLGSPMFIFILLPPFSLGCVTGTTPH